MFSFGSPVIISSGGDFIIAKYNTSEMGNSIQWQRSLGGSGDHRGFDIAVDSDCLSG